MFSISHRGSFKNLKRFLKTTESSMIYSQLNTYGKQGVAALASATPRSSGRTANSWRYRVEKNNGKYSIVWENTNINKGVPIAIILQYGHGTGTGGWVSGRDYINPAIRPVMDDIAELVWKAVKNA